MKATKLKFIITAFAIFIALIFLMAPIGVASHSISAATTTPTNYQPNIALNTNVTWNTYYSGWNPLEYQVNTTSNGTLNANYSQFYSNPVTVNPGDIIAPGSLQGEKIGSAGTWNSTIAASSTLYGNITMTGTQILVDGQPEIQEKATVIGTTGGGQLGEEIVLPTADLISSNPQYNYITMIISSNITTPGPDAAIQIDNGTTVQTITPSITDGVTYISISLAALEAQYGIGLNQTAGSGYAKNLYIIDMIDIPAGQAAGSYYSEINGFALTTQPLDLGTNSTGSQITSGSGSIAMAHFSPDFSYHSIISNGYTVAVSQYLQNVTQTQTPITSGSYIEQVGYQGTLKLPSAPGLTYGAANVTLNLAVPADQFQVLDINGASYLSTLGNRTNGTIALISAINPTTTNLYLAYVDYTASQWQSISHPAGIFTIAGIEYYWFIAVGAIAGLLGLAGGVRHAHNKAEQTEKVKGIGPRGRA